MSAKKFKIEPEVEFNSVFASKIKTWSTCPRKYYWEYVRNLQSKYLVLPFYMGSCFHKGVEMFYSGKTPEECLEMVSDYSDEYLDGWWISPEDEGNIEKSKAIVEGALEAYFELFKDEPGKWDVMVTEQSFGIQLPNIPVEFIGTIDLAFLKNKEAIIMDHKLHSVIGPHTIGHLDYDLQIMNYPRLITKTMGYEVAKVIYNVIKKPHSSMRPKKGETHLDFRNRLKNIYMVERDQYFHREVIKVTPKKLKEAFNDFCLLAEDIFRKYDGFSTGEILDPAHWPRNSGACFDFFKPCQFLGLCRYGDHPQDLVKFKQREGLDRGEIIREKTKPAGPKGGAAKKPVKR